MPFWKKFEAGSRDGGGGPPETFVFTSGVDAGLRKNDETK